MLRQSLNLQKVKPLDKATWAGAVDNLGGEVLSWMLSTMKENGVVGSVGLAASASLNTTVMPFILRGVRLLGINSGDSANDVRDVVWKRLGSLLAKAAAVLWPHHAGARQRGVSGRASVVLTAGRSAMGCGSGSPPGSQARRAVARREHDSPQADRCAA